MLDDFLCGVHKDLCQVHLGFGNEGVDVTPADFHRLMEAISSFDIDMVLRDAHGILPRAGVVAYGMTVQWDEGSQRVRIQIGGAVRFLTAQDWGQIMASLRTVLGCVTRWQRGALLPRELELPAAVLASDAEAAVAEAERLLREARKPH